MKEKIHISLLVLGICTFMGLTFANFSSQDTRLSSVESSSLKEDFVCDEGAIESKSKETRQYKANLKQRTILKKKQSRMEFDENIKNGTCDTLKGKEKTKCQINVAELKKILLNLENINLKIQEYEACAGIESENNITSGEVEKTEKKNTIEEKSKNKDCGAVTSEALTSTKGTTEENKNLVCFSQAIIDCSPAILTVNDSEYDTFVYQVYSKKGSNCPVSISVDTDKIQCGIPLGVITNFKNYAREEKASIVEILAPISYLIAFGEIENTETGEITKVSCQESEIETKKTNTKWNEGEWSTCTNGKQTRKVECQIDGKKVDDSKCSGNKPSTSKICKDSNSSTANSKDKRNSQQGITKVQGKYTTLEAAKKLAKFGIINDHSGNPDLYDFNALLTIKEQAEITLKAMKLLPSTPIKNYTCKNIFIDTPDLETCQIAETAFNNKITNFYRINEDGDIYFYGDRNVSIGDMFYHSGMSQCFDRSLTKKFISGGKLGEEAKELGIINTDSLNISSAGTKGDFYIVLATYIDYFNDNIKINPSYFDENIKGCSERILQAGGILYTDEYMMCQFYPDTCTQN